MRNAVERAKFLRRLYNLRDMLEREGEAEDTEENIWLLQTKIVQYERKYPMKSFHTEDPLGTWNNNNQGAGGGAGGLSARDFAELEEHGYEVNPGAGDISDGEGGVMKPLFSSKVRQPLSTWAPR